MEIRGLGQHNVGPLRTWLEPALRRGGRRRLTAKDFFTQIETPEQPTRIDQGGDFTISGSFSAAKNAFYLAEPGKHFRGHLRVSDTGRDGERNQRPLEPRG